MRRTTLSNARFAQWIGGQIIEHDAKDCVSRSETAMESLRPHFVWTLGLKGPTPEKWCSYPLHHEQRASHLARVLAIYPISLEEWERATLSELAARYPKSSAKIDG